MFKKKKIIVGAKGMQEKSFLCHADFTGGI